jgi:hypothetical protein
VKGSLKPYKKIGPLFETVLHFEVKDPCIAYDGTLWHIYGTGVSPDNSGLRIVHATAPEIVGPWQECPSADIGIAKTLHVAAPGVIFDAADSHFHMALQEDFTALGGKIGYLASKDGNTFSEVATALEPIPHSGEAGLYDPHFSLVKGEKYLVYAAMPGIEDRTVPFIPQPDIYLAKSESGLWAGPWKRLGRILGHDHIEWHHNKRDHPDYEWGIEGPQLLELPSGNILLIATCFLEGNERGTRQRVFFARSHSVEGPYESLGPTIEPEEAWESGENGHATGHILGDTLYLFYQARAKGGRWKYGLALFRISDI